MLDEILKMLKDKDNIAFIQSILGQFFGSFFAKQQNSWDSYRYNTQYSTTNTYAKGLITKATQQIFGEGPGALIGKFIGRIALPDDEKASARGLHNFANNFIAGNGQTLANNFLNYAQRVRENSKDDRIDQYKQKLSRSFYQDYYKITLSRQGKNNPKEVQQAVDNAMNSPFVLPRLIKSIMDPTDIKKTARSIDQAQSYIIQRQGARSPLDTSASKKAKKLGQAIMDMSLQANLRASGQTKKWTDKTLDPKGMQDLKSYGGLTSGAVAQLSKILAQSSQALEGAQGKGIDSAVQRFKKAVRDTASALMPLRDVFGQDVQAMVTALEGVSGQKIHRMSSKTINSLSSQIADTMRQHPTLTAGQIVKTSATLSNLAGAYKLKEVDQLAIRRAGIQLAHFMKSQTLTPWGMTSEAFRGSVAKDMISAQGSQDKQLWSRAYAVWKQKRDEKGNYVNKDKTIQDFKQIAVNKIRENKSTREAIFQVLGPQVSSVIQLQRKSRGSGYYKTAMKADWSDVGRQRQLKDSIYRTYNRYVEENKETASYQYSSIENIVKAARNNKEGKGYYHYKLSSETLKDQIAASKDYSSLVNDMQRSAVGNSSDTYKVVKAIQNIQNSQQRKDVWDILENKSLSTNMLTNIVNKKSFKDLTQDEKKYVKNQTTFKNLRQVFSASKVSHSQLQQVLSTSSSAALNAIMDAQTYSKLTQEQKKAVNYSQSTFRAIQAITQEDTQVRRRIISSAKSRQIKESHTLYKDLTSFINRKDGGGTNSVFDIMRSLKPNTDKNFGNVTQRLKKAVLTTLGGDQKASAIYTKLQNGEGRQEDRQLFNTLFFAGLQQGLIGNSQFSSRMQEAFKENASDIDKANARLYVMARGDKKTVKQLQDRWFEGTGDDRKFSKKGKQQIGFYNKRVKDLLEEKRNKKGLKNATIDEQILAQVNKEVSQKVAFQTNVQQWYKKLDSSKINQYFGDKDLKSITQQDKIQAFTKYTKQGLQFDLKYMSSVIKRKENETDEQYQLRRMSLLDYRTNEDKKALLQAKKYRAAQKLGQRINVTDLFDKDGKLKSDAQLKKVTGIKAADISYLKQLQKHYSERINTKIESDQQAALRGFNRNSDQYKMQRRSQLQKGSSLEVKDNSAKLLNTLQLVDNTLKGLKTFLQKLEPKLKNLKLSEGS